LYETRIQKPVKNKTTWNWKEGKNIGSGSFGIVMSGIDKKDNRMLAVKKIFFGDNAKSYDKIKELEEEIDIYREIPPHKNIVTYFGSDKKKDSLLIFLEYVEGGSISKVISNFGALTEDIVKMYTMQILDGLEHLHINTIIHRDIKGAYIMVDADGVCKLGDFGCAKKIAGLNSDFKSLKGTPNWMAPEVIQQQYYGRAADIWSLGSTIVEMITGKVPWYDVPSQFMVMTKIVEDDTLPTLPNNISPE